jgi:cation-transporting P-type ATPase E
MSPDEFDRVAEEATIFGRISPEQKERIVEALARRGHYVAMMGDGVNDALSLKKAKLGIAMQSGSNVTRNVADMVLLDDSFAALRPAFTEGKRIAGGLSSSMYLLLTRIATATLVIVAITMLGLGFPYEPSQGALVLFTVGIPSFFLTLWARPEPPRPHLLRSLARFVAPAAILTAVFGVAIYAYTYTFVLNNVNERTVPPDVAARFEAYTGLTYDVSSGFGVASATIVAQTNLSIFVAVTAFLLILLLEPPFRLFTGWTTKSPDRRPALLALGLFVVFLVVILTPTLANYFGLLRAGGLERDVMLVAVPLWFLSLRTAWRAKLFERFLSVDDPK